MKRNKRLLLFTTVITLTIILFAGGFALYYYKTHYVSVTFQPQKQEEISGVLNYPECGWYRLYSYYLHPDTALTENELYLEKQDDSGYTFRLALLEFNLAEYANTDLDGAAIENIRTVFQRFSTTKAKLIVRFLYDWDGLAAQKEPAKRSIIQKHMKQIARPLNEYANLIFTTQGIFVGNWAEMHGSKYLTTTDMTALIAYYAQVTDTSIYLSVRTPSQYRAIRKELEAHADRYDRYHIEKSRLLKRLGLYNDGMLGSVSDTGTYAAADNASSDEQALAIRKKELTFQNQLCKTVPNGGEVTTVNSFNDGENAISDLKRMHVSYLNQIYDEAVIEKWKQTAYTGTDPVYSNVSVYDYITEHLGARLLLKDCTITYKPFSSDSASGTLSLANHGFSPLYHDAKLTLSLVEKQTGSKTVIFSQKLQHDIFSQSEKKIPFSFSPFDLSPGNYTLFAVLTDAESSEQISFANNSFDDTIKEYRLGQITIKK